MLYNVHIGAKVFGCSSVKGAVDAQCLGSIVHLLPSGAHRRAATPAAVFSVQARPVDTENNPHVRFVDDLKKEASYISARENTTWTASASSSRDAAATRCRRNDISRKR